MRKWRIEDSEELYNITSFIVLLNEHIERCRH